MRRQQQDGQAQGAQPVVLEVNPPPQEGEQHEHHHVEGGDQHDVGIADLQLPQQVDGVKAAGHVHHQAPEHHHQDAAQVHLLAPGLGEQ